MGTNFLVYLRQILRNCTRWWSDLSIGRKLYIVVGAMAVLVTCELFTLFFIINTLSGVRAFVDGEGHWSKAQKDAVYELRRYTLNHDPASYSRFKELLRIQAGDRIARTELEKVKPNLTLVLQGFREGRIHPDDIPNVIRFFQRFRHISYVDEAIRVWSQAELLIDQLNANGELLHNAIRKKTTSPAFINGIRASLDEINERLTILEDEFSYALGEGSRWLERLVKVLTAALVLTVECTGLAITFSVSRSISRGLNELCDLTSKVRTGDFTARVPIRSRDEFGILANALNSMTATLEESIQQRLQAERALRDAKVDLERRVLDRTLNLEEQLTVHRETEQALRVTHEELTSAIQARDELISVASHELKTPITALKMQLDLTKRALTRAKEDSPAVKSVEAVVTSSQKQVDRLIRLIEGLLDVSAAKTGQLVFAYENTNLSELVKDVLARLSSQLARAGCKLSTDIENEVFAVVDPLRIEQILFNLIANNIKYAANRPVRVGLHSDENFVIILVKDAGPGISEEKLPHIFERYQRADAPKHVPGLGLGLYITRQIVDAHQGQINVSSKLSEGTTFYVKLPKRRAIPESKKILEIS